MGRYKNAYYKLFVSTCDVLDSVEKLEFVEKTPDETKEELRKIVFRIKEMHLEAEENIIKDHKCTKLPKTDKKT